MEFVEQLTGPGGEFEMREEDVLGTRLPVFVNRARSLGEVLARLDHSVAEGVEDDLVDLVDQTALRLDGLH